MDDMILAAGASGGELKNVKTMDAKNDLPVTAMELQAFPTTSHCFQPLLTASSFAVFGLACRRPAIPAELPDELERRRNVWQWLGAGTLCRAGSWIWLFGFWLLAISDWRLAIGNCLLCELLIANC